MNDLEHRWRRRADRLDWLARHVLAGPRTGGYRWLVVAWAGAVAARLTLLESLQAEWLLPSAALVIGAGGLLVWGGRLFWALSALGLALPLFFLRDWLTQSLIMLLIALVGTLTVHRPADGPDGDAGRRAAEPIRLAARWLVVLTYLVAVFHKLNRDFFDPTVSCANELAAQLERELPAVLGAVDPSSWPSLPWLAVGIELAVPVVLLWRPRLGLVVGLAFHLPLTFVLAPAFVFVMLIGYTAVLSPADRAALVDVTRRRWPWLLAIAIAVVAALIGLMGRWPVVDLAIKLVGLVFALEVAALAWLRQARGREPRATRDAPRASGKPALVALAAVVAFVANAATPYLGTQVQHTGAMLSNLRVDAGCWNHLIVPESVRLVDAYVRIDNARVDAVSASEALSAGARRLETLLEERLWNTVALRQMRRNWCGREPALEIALHGRIGAGESARSFALTNLCDTTEPLPRGPGLWLGREWLTDYLRFQKGLTRACPQACIH